MDILTKNIEGKILKTDDGGPFGIAPSNGIEIL